MALSRNFPISALLFNSFNLLKRGTHTSLTVIMYYPSWSRVFLHWLFSKSLRVSHVTKFNKYYFSLTHLVSQQHKSLYFGKTIIPVISFSYILLFLKMDYFQSSSLALLLTKFLVDWCCARLNTGFSLSCLYVFLLRNYIHIYASKWHLYYNNSQIYISSTDITLELQSYVLSCLPDIHLNISEQNKNLLGPTLNSPFPLTIISLKGLCLCYSCRKWHIKVPLYSVLISNFILRHWQFQLIPFSC